MKLSETNDIRPFLIGICGGPLSGKSLLSGQISSLIEQEYKVCKISLVNYYKNLSQEEYKNRKSYNFDQPQAIDFDLLYSDLVSLLSKKPVQLPLYDVKTCIREDKKIEIKQCDIIILEGIFAFYHEKIRNLIDLKIFINVDKDIQLSKLIYREMFDKGHELEDILVKYHKNIKPCYIKYILPTRKYADIILNQVDKNSPAIEIVSGFLKMQLNQTIKHQNEELFTFVNEIIDPKYKYYDGKILVENNRIFIDFLKEVFQDFISKKLEPELIPHIREKMVNMLTFLVIRNMKTKVNQTNLIDVDIVLSDDEPKNNKYLNTYKNIFYFKTSILSQEDIEGINYISSKNKKGNLFIFTIFLAPKYADILLNNENIVISTIYFSDFFIKFENIIKNREKIYNDNDFRNLFLEKVQKDFNYINGEDDLSNLKFHD